MGARNIGAELVEGLENAIAYAGGTTGGARTTIVEVQTAVSQAKRHKPLPANRIDEGGGDGKDV